MTKIIALFDFDHTIIEENSDVVLRNLLPKDVLNEKKLRALRPSWTAYMAEVFRLLPQHGFTPATILNTCRLLAPSVGMLPLFHYLKEIEAEIKILSDANTVIINTWLEHNLPEFNIEIVTNPAVWDGVQNSTLKVKPYQQQITCKHCPINLCKGSVIDKLLMENSDAVFTYTGDGKNDLCPSLRLRPQDLVFPRKSFTLETLLEKEELQAKKYVWSSGLEIKREICNLIEDTTKAIISNEVPTI